MDTKVGKMTKVVRDAQGRFATAKVSQSLVGSPQDPQKVRETWIKWWVQFCADRGYTSRLG